MIRLVYVSTSSFTFKDCDLDDIISVATARNAAHDVTGLLVYNGLNFMQALEGPTEQVLSVMQSIVNDPRHSGIVVISREAISERAFPAWAMRLARTLRAGPGTGALLAGNDFDSTLARTMPPNLAMMFENFASL
ncbi:MAG: BLUF domain-containing protein [Hyphomicrobiaceae bacterium]